MKEKIKNKQNGITLIALVVTIVILLILAGITIRTITGENGLITQSKFAAFSTNIDTYNTQVRQYVLAQQLKSGGGNVNVEAYTKEEWKQIVPDISDEDAEKYVVQDNQLKYRKDKVSSQEETWLASLGILAMSAVFTITFVSKGNIYKTISTSTIRFPDIDPIENEVFSGWYYDEDYSVKAETGSELVQDITLYAKFDEIITEHWTTFMTDGTIFAKIQGNTITFPTTTPTKENVKFTGWYYDESCTRVVTEGDIITEDIVVYPRWNSYITNKLDEAELFISKYYSNFGDSTWHYVNDSSELPSFQDSYFSPVYYPAWVKYGAYSAGDVLYTYIGSKAIVAVEVVSSKRLDGVTDYDYQSLFNISESGVITTTGAWMNLTTIKVNIEVTFEDGTKDTDMFYYNACYACFAEGTKITLSDYTTKNVEDITYEDKLLVWDFDNGCFSEAKPLWIKEKQTIYEYNYIKFEDGTELKTIADHRIFNVDSQKFTYTMNEEDTPIGTKVFKQDGTTTRLVERKVVQEEVNYYNIITDYHMNLFANGLLTSLRLNNLYPIKDMKFIKDDRKLATRADYPRIPERYFRGLRIEEQPKQINRGNDAKHTNTLTEYVERLLLLEKGK